MTDQIEITITDGAAQVNIVEQAPEITVQVSADLPVTMTNPLPKGGTTGQVLAKQSLADYDTAWTSFDDLSLWLENQLI